MNRSATMLVVVASFSSAAFAEDKAQDSPAKRAEIKRAANDCGTKVKFSDLPPEIASITKAAFALDLDPKATSQQRACFYSKIPTQRVGFISEPPAAAKKK